MKSKNSVLPVDPCAYGKVVSKGIEGCFRERMTRALLFPVCFYLILIQPIHLFLWPLIAYDELKLPATDSNFLFSISLGAWRHFFIAILGIVAGRHLWERRQGAFDGIRRYLHISLVSAVMLVAIPLAIPFHSFLRTTIRAEQAWLFMKTATVVAAIYVYLYAAMRLKTGADTHASNCLWRHMHTPIIVVIAGLCLSAAAFCTKPIDVYEAAWEGDLAAVKRFINVGIDVNVTDTSRNTPLHFAGTSETAEFLLSTGMQRSGPNAKAMLKRQVDWCNASMETPLHRAAFYARVNIAAVLIHYGADVNALSEKNDPGKPSWTPLDYALYGKALHRKGNYDAMIGLLVENGGKAKVMEWYRTGLQEVRSERSLIEKLNRLVFFYVKSLGFQCSFSHADASSL